MTGRQYWISATARPAISVENSARAVTRAVSACIALLTSMTSPARHVRASASHSSRITSAYVGNRAGWNAGCTSRRCLR